MNKPHIPKLLVISTVAIAALATIASLLGLFAGWPYAHETLNWRQQAWGQDVGNLIATVVMLISLLFARRGSSRSVAVWIGSLFYFLYAYLVYAMAVHFSALFLVYIATLGLTYYTLLFARQALSMPKVTDDGARKFAGSILLGIGILFALLWLSEILPATFAGTIPKSLTDAGLVANPIHVIDLAVLLPAFIVTGILALKRRRRGIVYVAPWLVFSALMGASIVAAMVIMSLDSGVSAGAPMVIVGLVVALSTFAAVRYLRAVK